VSQEERRLLPDFGQQLVQIVRRGSASLGLDVYEISNIGGHLIPLAELPTRVNELDASQEIIALCKMGTRSARAVEVLHQAGFEKVRNLTGGIRAWSDRVDPRVRKY